SDGGAIQLGLRPEHVRVAQTGDSPCEAEVLLVERLGDRTLVYASLADGREITAEDTGNSRAALGDRICLRIDGSSAHLFDAAGNGHHAASESAA
ncbi:MAG: TOBE domain-containing protein, partial [Sphingomonadales bacterium]